MPNTKTKKRKPKERKAMTKRRETKQRAKVWINKERPRRVKTFSVYFAANKNQQSDMQPSDMASAARFANMANMPPRYSGHRAACLK